MANDTQIDLAKLIESSDIDLPLDSPFVMDMIKNITVNSTEEREMECELQKNQSQVRNSLANSKCALFCSLALYECGVHGSHIVNFIFKYFNNMLDI